MMVFGGKSSPFMAELFRLVKYFNLPRYMGNYFEKPGPVPGEFGILFPGGTAKNFQPWSCFWFDEVQLAQNWAYAQRKEIQRPSGWILNQKWKQSGWDVLVNDRNWAYFWSVGQIHRVRCLDWDRIEPRKLRNANAGSTKILWVQ